MNEEIFKVNNVFKFNFLFNPKFDDSVKKIS